MERQSKRLTEAEIEEIYNKVIVPHYERYLRDKGVKLPQLRKAGRFTKDALVLVYLAQGYPDTQWVTKVELTEFVRKFFPETPDVQSGRHLGMQSGFYISSTRRGNIDVPKELKGEALVSGQILCEWHEGSVDDADTDSSGHSNGLGFWLLADTAGLPMPAREA